MSGCERQGCSGEIRQKRTGPVQRYCSHACRQAGYQTRKNTGESSGAPWQRPAAAREVPAPAVPRPGPASPRPGAGAAAPRWSSSRVVTGEDQGDEDPGARDEDGEDGDGGGQALTTHADVALALAQFIVAVLPPARRGAGVIEPTRVISPQPAPGRQLDRRPRPAPPGRRAGRQPAEVEVEGVTLSAHMPPSGRSCQACHVRTGSTQAEDAKCRVLISGSQEFGLPPMFDACPWCAAELHQLGRVLEAPALLPRSA